MWTGTRAIFSSETDSSGAHIGQPHSRQTHRDLLQEKYNFSHNPYTFSVFFFACVQFYTQWVSFDPCEPYTVSWLSSQRTLSVLDNNRLSKVKIGFNQIQSSNSVLPPPPIPPPQVMQPALYRQFWGLHRPASF